MALPLYDLIIKINKQIKALCCKIEFFITTKQDNLVSGENIKTIEGQSILGSGNIDLNKSDVGINTVRHAFNSPFSYMGVAVSGSSEGANVWTITRIDVATNGTTTKAYATGVNWTNYQTHVYT